MSASLESLQQAYELHRGGRLDEAERMYRQILAAEPHNAHALHLLGAVAHQRGQHALAVDLITRAIGEDAGQFVFYMNLAASNVALGRNEPAIAAMREVIRLQPDHAKTHNDLGVLLANQGRLDEATDVLRQVLRIQPNYGPAHNNLGNILNQQGGVDEAMECFREAIRLQPDMVQAYNNLGNALKGLGRIDEAVECYRDALRIAPNYVEGHYNLALTLNDQEKPDEAIAAYRQALHNRPNFVEARFNLGNLLKAQGLYNEAAEAFETVVSHRPNFAEAYYQWSGVLKAQGKIAQTRTALQECIRLKPALAEAHHALGNLFWEQGQVETAIDCHREALRHNPKFVEARNNLGTALHRLGRLDEAEQCLRQTLDLEPQRAEAHSNLGLVLLDLDRTAEAIACQREALRLSPDLATAHNGLGMALERQGAYDEALASFRQTVRLRPKSSEAFNNLACALKSHGKYGEAIICFEEALRLNANFPKAPNALQVNEQALELRPGAAEAASYIPRLPGEQADYASAMSRYSAALLAQPAMAAIVHNRALTLLLTGDFAAGWPEYELRFTLPDAPVPPCPQPLWDGSPLAGRTILLHPEQGLGDSLQFIRYAPLVKARGGTVVVACPKRMLAILSTCAGVDRFVCEDEPLPHCDARAPLLSLPGIFKTDLGSIPADVPYLSAAEERVAHWRKALDVDDRLRVGINWQGSTTYRDDRHRSVPLAEFAPLSEIEGVRLLSLQQGAGTEQLDGAPFAVEDLGTTLDESERAFCETAAVVKNLDLVVTSDTALAHLAGALGATAWVAIPFSPDWRWLLDREDSPWYPTLRLFRQSRSRDWAEVFRRIAKELSGVVARRRQ